MELISVYKLSTYTCLVNSPRLPAEWQAALEAVQEVRAAVGVALSAAEQYWVDLRGALHNIRHGQPLGELDLASGFTLIIG